VIRRVTRAEREPLLAQPREEPLNSHPAAQIPGGQMKREWKPRDLAYQLAQRSLGHHDAGPSSSCSSPANHAVSSRITWIGYLNPGSITVCR
jgi:hypothetical protein